MSRIASKPFRIPPLRRGKLAQIASRAKRLGVEPGDYTLRLIEVGLEVERDAESQTFAQIMGGIRAASGDVDEHDIVRLVTQARGGNGRRVKG